MDYKPTSQTVSWFRDLFRASRLTIKPPYQRRPVWQNRQKSKLIETILLKLPIPEIYVHVTIDEEGTSQYAVVDGQQRIRAILQFIGAEEEAAEREYNRFRLEHLDASSSFSGICFDDLTVQQKKDFFGYALAVREIYEATDEAVRDVFTRLNKFLTKLNDQELRNAIYSGPFVQLVEQFASDEYWAESGIVSPALIRRMKDVEFVSDLLIGVIDGPQAGKVDVIDEYYRRFEDFEDEFPDQSEIRRRFVRTLSLIQRVAPDIRETRWKNRTDFYTLFVACAHKLRTHVAGESERALHELREQLGAFAEQVASAISSAQADVGVHVRKYADAHEKGSTDKSRRAARHEALLSVIDGFFREKKAPSPSRKAV